MNGPFYSKFSTLNLFDLSEPRTMDHGRCISSKTCSRAHARHPGLDMVLHRHAPVDRHTSNEYYRVARGPKYSTSTVSGIALTCARTTSRRGRLSTDSRIPIGSNAGDNTNPPSSLGSSVTWEPTAGMPPVHFTRTRCVSRLHFLRSPLVLKEAHAQASAAE